MQIGKNDVIYGGGAGALIAVAYQFGRAWYAGDASTALDPSLLAAAAVGAVAGVLALALRSSA